MRKSDLIQRIALLNPDLLGPVCRAMVEKLFDAITERLVDGGDVELRGFGRFFLSHHAQRTARNPRTGENFLRREFAAVRFRAGKSICAQINAKVSSKSDKS
ncbi:HU family DNA-binding protein [Sphingomonas sp. PAMC 26621]|uniref:HU family DNA-binding protein n=1 Tax=Sphingomonas sp. PAMC 26621 TaxID=1112213 RepID=UPI000287DEBD|nr:HU family DNA-binding protein [Sphingomonas sp. PAMC 26621]